MLYQSMSTLAFVGDAWPIQEGKVCCHLNPLDFILTLISACSLIFVNEQSGGYLLYS